LRLDDPVFHLVFPSYLIPGCSCFPDVPHKASYDAPL